MPSLEQVAKLTAKKLLLDDGLLKAIGEVQDEETVDYEDVRELISNYENHGVYP